MTAKEIKQKKRKDKNQPASTASKRTRITDDPSTSVNPIEEKLKAKFRQIQEQQSAITQNQPQPDAPNSIVSPTVQPNHEEKQTLEVPEDNLPDPSTSESSDEDEYFTHRAGAIFPWMKVPRTFDHNASVSINQVTGLYPPIAQAFQNIGHSDILPVQAAVWNVLSGGYCNERDICVSSPTGTGKTIAYLLPVLNRLARCPSSYIRALIIVPSKDLAAQVHQVTQSLCARTNLVTLLASGAVRDDVESRALLGDTSCMARAPDIVVCTPGRIGMHLQQCHGLNLGAVLFLVLDEFDQLIRQNSYQVIPSIVSTIQRHATQILQPPGEPLSSPATVRQPAHYGHSFVKMMVTATMTKDPAKLSYVQLRNPLYVTVGGERHRSSTQRDLYRVPEGLSEYILTCPAHLKAAYTLFCLQQCLTTHPGVVLIITGSLNVTTRLVSLLQLTPSLTNPQNPKSPDPMPPGDDPPKPHKHTPTPPTRTPIILEYSASVTAATRRSNLALLKSGAARVMVTSDAITRGMDVPNVSTVINYDPPITVKQYVHRAGRTARAGAHGRVITIASSSQAKYFKSVRSLIINGQLKRYRTNKDGLQQARQEYEQALATLDAHEEQAK